MSFSSDEFTRLAAALGAARWLTRRPEGGG